MLLAQLSRLSLFKFGVASKVPQFQLFKNFTCTRPHFATLNQVIRGCRKSLPIKPKAPALDKCPQRRGVCVKIFTVKPKKPNSAQRQVARVKLSSGKVKEVDLILCR
jgi:small subunit ribosomal protein S12